MLYQGNSYTSRQYVPIGVDILNEEYWANTGNYNAQVEAYRQEVYRLAEDVDNIESIIPEKAFSFETVADMKASENLFDGAICHTNGFHVTDDGGAAWYVISNSGTANEMDVIACGELFANLVVETFVTPEMVGAYGNNTNDDTAYLNYVFANYRDVKSSDRRYKITDTVTIPSNTNVELHSVVTYNGSDSAIEVTGIYSNVYMKTIYAPNGNCLALAQYNYDLNTAYNNVSFDYLEGKRGLCLLPTNHGVQNNIVDCGFIKATEYGIYITAGQSQDSSAPSYSGENKFMHGRVFAPLAVYIEALTGFEVNSTLFQNVSLEGSTKGFKLEALDRTDNTFGKINSVSIENCRIAELNDTILEIIGNVRDGKLTNYYPFAGKFIEATSTANLNHPFVVDCPLFSGNFIASIDGANISSLGVLFKANGYRMSSTEDVYNFDISANTNCPQNVYRNSEGTTEWHLPYVDGRGTNEFYITQTGANRISKVYGANDHLVFDGTNKGVGTFHVVGLLTSSSTQWVEV